MANATLGLALLIQAQWVIPPGREGILIQMLDVKGLPESCSLAGADPNKSIVEVMYLCGAGGATKVKLELHHPDAAPKDAAARTAKFAMVLGTTAPPGLLDAVAQSVRAHEGSFEWMRTADSPPPPQQPKNLWILAAAAAVVLALIGVLVMRRSRRTPA